MLERLSPQQLTVNERLLRLYEPHPETTTAPRLL
jgi:hypothetical protein